MRNDLPYDLTHYVFQAGLTGRLLTLNTIPVEAGARLALDMAGVVQMSPFRRNLTMDARVDFVSFFIPHRHHYGQEWIDFIIQGVDENVTFTGYTLPEDAPTSYLGGDYRGEVPKWLVDGYVMIFNRYWRVPTYDEDILPLGWYPPAKLSRRYGRQVTYLPRIWNTGTKTEVTPEDYMVGVSGNQLSLLEFAQQKARLRSERVREWFGQRYNDVMQRVYGTSVNVDADQRPTQLSRTMQWLSGYDVDGSDDATLGSYAGKGQVSFNHRIPARVYNEHGVIWTVVALRFPSVHMDEVHYLTKKVNPSYKEIAGDPAILVNEPPEKVNLNDYFSGVGMADDVGNAPYGQHYRMHPDHVHVDYKTIDGFPFIGTRFSSRSASQYVVKDDYNRSFQTQQLGHYQVRARCGVMKWSPVPPVDASIFAGSR